MGCCSKCTCGKGKCSKPAEEQEEAVDNGIETYVKSIFDTVEAGEPRKKEALKLLTGVANLRDYGFMMEDHILALCPELEWEELVPISGWLAARKLMMVEELSERAALSKVTAFAPELLVESGTKKGE